MAHIEDHDGTPVFVHIVDENRYSFSVSGLIEEKHQWFCEVLGRQMDEIHNTAVYRTEKHVKADIRKALGL